MKESMDLRRRKGASNINFKPAQIQEIRQRFEARKSPIPPVNLKEVDDKFGVSASTIDRMIRRKTYALAGD